MLYKGVDLGNGYVKFDSKKFASRVKVGEAYKFGKQKKDVYEVSYEGVTYTVGEGSIFTGENRYYSKEYKLCLLTAIALSYPNEDFIEVSICVGLPEKKHKIHGEKLTKHIKDLGQQQIRVNEKDYVIRINDAIVFIEAAYPILAEEEGKVVVIDQGAGTVNVTQWEDLSIVHSSTYTDSMYKMYADIANYLNSNKGSDFKPTDIEKLLNKKSTTIGGKETDITDIRPIIQNYITEISSFINNDFDVNTAEKLYLMGGGGMDLISYWQKQYPNIELVPDGQTINSKVYEMVAKKEFGEDEQE
jgi:plasmid segregation protein ParM